MVFVMVVAVAVVVVAVVVVSVVVVEVSVVHAGMSKSVSIVYSPFGAVLNSCTETHSAFSSPVFA